MHHPFWTSLGKYPAMLAPLAGVSDRPFRMVCQSLGASLTYVEMISAQALIQNSKKTFVMMARDEREPILGVQVTAPDPDTMSRAIGIINQLNFETIDINMGCPVRKVVHSGCGSALLKDVDNLFAVVRAAVQATDKPVSVKIRIGWDHQSINCVDVGEACEKAGAQWLTIHGRTRSDDYSAPIALEVIAATKKRLTIPVLGNGNIFSQSDNEFIRTCAEVDGTMISRGALGHPWVFREIRKPEDSPRVTLEEWTQLVQQHLRWQRELFQDGRWAAVCMRKHLGWYLKGWPDARKWRPEFQAIENIDAGRRLVESFHQQMVQQGVQSREVARQTEDSGRFLWNPKPDFTAEELTV